MLDFDFPADRIRADQRVLAREIPTIQRRALSATIRAARQEAGRQMRQRSGLRPGSAARRVKSYPSRGRVWVGATPPQILSLMDARKVPTRGRGRPGVALGGRRLPGVFTAPSVGGGRVALRRNDPPARGVGVYRLESYPPLEQAARRAILEARKRAGEVMPAEIERQIRVAIRERARR